MFKTRRAAMTGADLVQEHEQLKTEYRAHLDSLTTRVTSRRNVIGERMAQLEVEDSLLGSLALDIETS